MKRIVQEPGVRKWSGEDFLALQEEPLKVLDLMFKPYGSCIIEGCEVVGNEIKPGIVALEGVDVNGQPTFKVVPFSGADGIPRLPAYLYLAVDTDVREYADGGARPVSHSYYAKVAFTTPPANSIAINSAGKGRRLLDAIQDNERRFVTDAEKNTWSSKASTAVASTSANGLMSSADKTKLNSIASKANNYVHPNAHPASIITETSSKRFVSDTEKNIWNSKASTAVASTSANGLMSSADKAKLNKYPADGKGWGQINAHTGLNSVEEVDACRESGFYGINHGTIIGETSGDGGLFVMAGRNDTKQIAWNLVDILKFRGNDNPQIAGSEWSPWYIFWHSGNSEQFTSAEKTKLSGIAANANNYTHPSKHPASIITETSSKRFVTDAEKNKWNAKASTAVASPTANGLMSREDKIRLDNAESIMHSQVASALSAQIIKSSTVPTNPKKGDIWIKP